MTRIGGAPGARTGCGRSTGGTFQNAHGSEPYSIAAPKSGAAPAKAAAQPSRTTATVRGQGRSMQLIAMLDSIRLV